MEIKAMRDVFLASLYENMKTNDKIFFVAADFGSPILDKIRADYPNRFINVGIAEQNLINVSVGLALEGFIVYAYAIAPFITMRCFEQIRVNVAVLSSVREMNINIVGVGAGVSYAMSGPTHHCLEDLAIMSLLPNMQVFSPSDYILAKEYVKYTLDNKSPKYIRFDAKPMVALSEDVSRFEQGYRVLKDSKDIAIISTGYMSHKAYEIAQEYDVKLIDMYLINSFDTKALAKELKDISTIITIEEGFGNGGGLDSQINYHFKDKKVINLAFEKKYTFEVGSREFVHEANNLGKQHIIDTIKSIKC